MTSGELPDSTLVSAMRSGDRSAFEQVIGAYYHGLLAYLTFHTHSADVAEDLLQDLFLRLWRTRETLVVTHGLKTYLYAAARNQLKNHIRGATRARRTAEVYGQQADPPGAGEGTGFADAMVERDELERIVRRAIDALPERAREVWHLHHERGLRYAEVAEVMGISVNTVKSQMGRAAGLLREALEPLLIMLLVARW